MKRFGSVAVAGVVLMALVGCSGSDATEVDPPTAGSSPSASSAPADDKPVAAGGDCSVREADDDVEVSYGEMSAASDEWSADLGHQWRHYYPMTIKNVSDNTCLFTVATDVFVDGDSKQQASVNITLKPGQTYSLQLFELESVVDFTADAEGATPVKPTEIKYTMATKRISLPDYYDADIDFGEVTGSGAEKVLPMTITINGVSEGEPKRASTSKDDYLIVNALDGKGDVVGSVWLTIDPAIAEGETRAIELPLGGGSSSGVSYVKHPTSDFDKAVSFEVAELTPSAMHRRK